MAEEYGSSTWHVTLCLLVSVFVVRLVRSFVVMSGSRSIVAVVVALLLSFLISAIMCFSVFAHILKEIPN
ncbi:unnamed protein product [Gongylonema pulchrum]|uniref:Ovule protein n=1 Tax=Gongylonema pulchrum TaxID=637853 RepID=A0A183EL63_9BILA|nr:unnamed protein product [Gongylonema pulchrum]